MIPPARRAVEAAALIAQGRWFSRVSGRQTGKTPVVQHLTEALTAEGTLRAVWVELKTARGTPGGSTPSPIRARDVTSPIARSPSPPRTSSARRRRSPWSAVRTSTRCSRGCGSNLAGVTLRARGAW